VATLTIRNVAARLKEQLRVRAARHGHSMEAELRQILKEALADRRDRRNEVDLATAIRRRFEPLGGLDHLEAHPPVLVGEAPVLDR
jgi:plasmid stability protein